MHLEILLLTAIAIAILVIIEMLRILWTDDPCPKKPDIDIGEEAWRLEAKKAWENSHTDRMEERKK